MPSITDLPRETAFARFHEGFGQRFILTVDTEEEFNWNAPFQRSGHRLDHVGRLAKFQQFCEGLGVIPTYLMDYPIADSPRAAEILRGPMEAGLAEAGAQLHPWVNPPHDEPVNDFNSFAGNLPYALERAKLFQLRDRISRNFGVTPRIYRAGRYGLGPNTASILCEAGIAIDTSVRARFDYSSGGGRNYRDHPVHPYWIDTQCKLLELPLTTVFTGALRKQAGRIYPALWRMPRMRGIMARLKLMERVPLTPEGVTVREAIHATDVAVDKGLPLLVFSFHSPSLHPGSTPYVRDEADLDRLYDWWRGLFAHLAARGVRPTTVSEIMGSVEL
ncbi:polysaccharide deacetylase family protein [Tsuneonella sp. CC-YZS046]|uniref:polysaccharide deacetylase family protein n=1 Tax=Tsuneonella sp. CC-YZS046 TaxID=3042152 RepID=UPI002D789743|nr:polysaccharide deacetylase family protein [Tsuneonella sp. CC-YZS046]WRO67394.1 polysaccharide deacetylase family protein [Tsuneonella sp. CC-YZS046]